MTSFYALVIQISIGFELTTKAQTFYEFENHSLYDDKKNCDYVIDF